jgi:Domain of unknown function (DUF4190)
VSTLPPPPAPAAYGVVPYRAQRTNGLAVASLVLGIVSFFCVGFLFPVPLLAIIFGHVSLDRIGRSGGAEKGRGLAIAGLVLGWIFIVPIMLVSIGWLGYGISNL